jgi:hypothetical protein
MLGMIVTTNLNYNLGLFGLVIKGWRLNNLSRITNAESGRKDRDRLSKSIVKALRLLMTKSQPDRESYDLAAYIALALQAINDTIDTSVQAWEKRGYWVKADRYRLEWEWCGEYAARLRKALRDDSWQEIAMISVQTGQKLGKIQLSPRNRLGTPWEGAWEILKGKM